ncbi:MAG: hypothetical protein AAFV30_05425, partial [Pseudomonadota bacterium]
MGGIDDLAATASGAAIDELGAPDRRTCIRFKGSRGFLAYDASEPQGVPQFIVDNFSLHGCRLCAIGELSSEYRDGEIKDLIFVINEEGEENKFRAGQRVKGQIQCVHAGNRSFSFVFKRPLRLERIEPFEKFFVEPSVSTPAERRRTYTQQEKLALSDIQDLHAATRDNVNRQFQLKMVALPSIGGLLAAGGLLNFELADGPVGELPPGFLRALAILVPVFCAFVSLIAFLVYSQKASRIRERTAFSLLLQRYIYLGAFPPCYRGWHDAQLNMRQLELRGSSRP